MEGASGSFLLTVQIDVCEEECKALEKLPFGSRSIFQFCKAAPLCGLCSGMFFSRVDK